MHPLLDQEPLAYEKDKGRKGQLRKIVVIRTLVSERARGGGASRAIQNWWMLSATQFRLVSESGRSFYPVGYLTCLDRDKAIELAKRKSAGRAATTTPADKAIEITWRGTQLKLWVRPQQWKFIAPAPDRTGRRWFFTSLGIEREWNGREKELVVDWVYRLPVEEVPAYMVFRRVAKATVPKALVGKEAGKVLFSKEFMDRVLHRRG